MKIRHVEVFLSPTQLALWFNKSPVLVCELTKENTLADALDAAAAYCRAQKIEFDPHA